MARDPVARTHAADERNDEDEESELLPVLAQPECDPGRAADGRASSKTGNRLQEGLLRADMTTDLTSAPDADNGFTE